MLNPFPWSPNCEAMIGGWSKALNFDYHFLARDSLSLSIDKGKGDERELELGIAKFRRKEREQKWEGVETVNISETILSLEQENFEKKRGEGFRN